MASRVVCWACVGYLLEAWSSRFGNGSFHRPLRARLLSLSLSSIQESRSVFFGSVVDACSLWPHNIDVFEWNGEGGSTWDEQLCSMYFAVAMIEVTTQAPQVSLGAAHDISTRDAHNSQQYVRRGVHGDPLPESPLPRLANGRDAHQLSALDHAPGSERSLELHRSIYLETKIQLRLDEEEVPELDECLERVFEVTDFSLIHRHSLLWAHQPASVELLICSSLTPSRRFAKRHVGCLFHWRRRPLGTGSSLAPRTHRRQCKSAHQIGSGGLGGTPC